MAYKHERLTLTVLRDAAKNNLEPGEDIIDYYLNNKPNNWRLVCVNSILTVDNDECYDFYWWVGD